MIVLDDFTPCPTWPPLDRGRVDTLRLDWLSDERFTSVDVMVAEDTSVVIAVRSSARATRTLCRTSSRHAVGCGSPTVQKPLRIIGGTLLMAGCRH